MCGCSSVNQKTNIIHASTVAAPFSYLIECAFKLLLYCWTNVFQKLFCAWTENNWSVVTVKRSKKKKKARLNVLVVFTCWSDESVSVLSAWFFLFVLVNLKKKSPSVVTSVASCFCAHLTVAVVTQTVQHMDFFVKTNREKEHFQVLFWPIIEQRDHCCGGDFTKKNTLNLCLIRMDFSWRFLDISFVFHRIWTVPLKMPSLCSVFIDARQDVAGCSLETVRGEEKKT